MSSNRQQIISRKAVGSTVPPSLHEPQVLPTVGQSRPSGRSGGIHWRAYTTMVTSLLLGILLALGHHLFYNSLDGKPVGASEHVIRGVTRQQLNLTLGTLFAFLVKAFLAVAVTTVYTQIAWRAIKKRATTLGTIDTIFHVVSNFWSLISFSVWWKYPLLLLLALTMWLIPIASVITPAALTVAIAATNPVPWMMARVPNVDFLSLNFGNIENSRGSFTYTGPRYAVDKVVAATAAQGNVLALTPPVPNSSWVLDFLGPSIICTGVNDSTLDTIKQNIQAAVAIDQCQISFGYIAWTPTYTSSGDANELSILPFVLSQNSTSYALQNAPLGPFPVGSEDAPLPATFYAALFPNMTDENQEIGGCISCQPCHENPLPDITVIQCELYNSSYYAFFSFIDGEQNINITLDETPHNSVPTTQFLYGDSTEDETAIYNANGTVIAYNTAEVQKLSYQAVMGSFGSVVVGAIWNSKDSSGGIITNGTSVMSTVLGEAEELAWLNSYPPLFESSASTFQQTIALDPSGQYWNGIDVVDDIQSGIPFAEALESLFQNITIELMSSKLLQPNISSPYAPPETNVTLPKYETVYIYSPFRLWIAYGLAILFSTLAALIGLFAMLSNGAAYTNHFSTILRTARNAQMETSILPEDADDKDPLPKYLARASVAFEDGGGGEGMEERRSWRGMSWIGEMKSPGVSEGLLAE